ncbi:hypothetical protein [Heyndrickxia sporothermodurans]|uniref:Uncharacterized protein n=1 Tax=Heyndrickxia sporothermodurans TaxID=46224 RepID=A0AB37HJB1_9BACI|nr:hypothetical protein [Heyndrickxia sporothermodurans]MBL5769026.1 hypothetical protein [Heyndrickxia sporothermodurans]MBL5772734.1 hypothetical protein [Heyndrickxia sporothermodurans]MBL5783712.1 hypothetical protein [Heyndrickxia sporothermodurans]MBL5786900.1 hypothetical protein [Heyndrickxia sporothermodurans]MBL5790449.1 hypothetical protein [Heyndrickxia sporothermodurans]
MNPYETNIERILNQREVSNNHLERHPFIIDTIDPIVEVKHVPSNEHVPTESKEIDTVTEWCSSCELEVELPQQFKKQTCPNCKEVILPCAQCVDMNCKNCPLK